MELLANFCFGPPEFGLGHLKLPVTGPEWPPTLKLNDIPGYIYNFRCIERWLKGQGGKCPQCNAKAARKDIRVIYAKALRVNGLLYNICSVNWQKQMVAKLVVNV